jgi:hypothetical protein
MQREARKLNVRHVRLEAQQARWRPIQREITRNGPRAFAVAQLDARNMQPIRKATGETLE